MGRKKVKNTLHSFIRAKERTALRKREIEKIIKEAQRAGKTYKCLKDGPLRDFLARKGDAKRVKFYKNYVFVFARTSTACITMYPVSEEIIAQQREYELRLADNTRA